MCNRLFDLPKTLFCDENTLINLEIINRYIDKHEQMVTRYKYLENLYFGFFDEDSLREVRKYLVVNFPQHITKAFLEYYINPIEKMHPDELVKNGVTEFDKDNDVLEHDYELIKKCCIYGHVFEYFYQDEMGKTKLAICDPKECFIVFDGTMKCNPLFAVRYGYRYGGNIRYGEVITCEQRYHFDGEVIEQESVNPYGKINVVEYIFNQERMGIFEECIELIELYNMAIKEKADIEFLEYLEKHIYRICRFQLMSNLVESFDKKLRKSMDSRYEIFCCLSNNVTDKDAWQELRYTIMRNIPEICPKQIRITI